METRWVTAAEWREYARSLTEDGWWLADLCGLDCLHLGNDVRFEVVAQFLHHRNRDRHTVHVPADGDPPTVPSITGLWPGANFLEREAYDMFGIHFEDHPNLTRILMPEDWEGYPLRKDYGVGKVPIEFVEQPFLQINSPGQSAQGGEAGRAVDVLGQPVTPSPGADKGARA